MVAANQGFFLALIIIQEYVRYCNVNCWIITFQEYKKRIFKFCLFLSLLICILHNFHIILNRKKLNKKLIDKPVLCNCLDIMRIFLLKLYTSNGMIMSLKDWMASEKENLILRTYWHNYLLLQFCCVGKIKNVLYHILML